jgi:hypothetical protein
MNKDKAALDLLDEVTSLARSGDVQGTLLKVADIIADNVQLREEREVLIGLLTAGYADRKHFLNHGLHIGSRSRINKLADILFTEEGASE